MSVNLQRETVYATWPTSGVTAASGTIAGTDGWLKQAYFKMPAMSSTVSGTLNIYDTAGNKLYASTTNIMSGAGTSAMLGLTVPLNPEFIVEFKLSGIPGSAAGLSATPLTASVVLFSSKDP